MITDEQAEVIAVWLSENMTKKNLDILIDAKKQPEVVREPMVHFACQSIFRDRQAALVKDVRDGKCALNEIGPYAKYERDRRKVADKMLPIVLGE